ncbi:MULTISPECIES: universal stress protein [Haloarcula]|uniref:universal stress protein n=1 Tax=Haloarcula TaxID=2237 RepID=UPI0023EB4827|nr:universal stress protein [Halomicroarcula sp. XH51]
MYEIVVGIDRDETRARAQATELTSLPLDTESVHVTLVHDFEQNREGAFVTQIASVRRAKELLEDAGIDVSLEGTSGDPGAAIRQVADDQDADLIVLAGRKRSPAGKALFGSVTQDVILGTDRSVLVVSSERDED